jgi:hypothetical protein
MFKALNYYINYVKKRFSQKSRNFEFFETIDLRLMFNESLISILSPFCKVVIKQFTFKIFVLIQKKQSVASFESKATDEMFFRRHFHYLSINYYSMLML